MFDLRKIVRNIQGNIIIVYVAAMLLTMMACAPSYSSGTLKRPSPFSLISLGMPQSGIKAQFGEPERKITRTEHGKNVELYEYLYAFSDIGSALNTFKFRHLHIEFVEGRVNGWSYSSSFAEDGTRISSMTHKSFVVGKTSKAEIKATLGVPPGQVLIPTVLGSKGDSPPETSRSAWIYNYIGFVNDTVTYSQFLMLYFDEREILVHVTYEDERKVNTTASEMFAPVAE